MKGPKRDMVKLSEQGVVTEEALIAYLHDKLSPEEKQQLEKLLLEDPFAADALEGLKSSANQAAVSTSISSLNKKVRERTGLKERKKLTIHWVTYAWAAVLIGLLVGIGFVMINFLNKSADHNMALNEKKEQSPAPLMQPKDTQAIVEKADKVITDSLSTGKTMPPPHDTSAARPHALTATGGTAHGTITTTPVSGSINANNASSVSQNKPAVAAPAGNVTLNQVTTSGTSAPATVTSSDKNVMFSKSTVAADQKVSQSNVAKQGYYQAADTTTMDYAAYKNNGVTSAERSKKELRAEEKEKDYALLQGEAMKSFNSGDYVTAADDFDKILKHDPDNQDALYFGGVSDYINGKSAKSENNFDKLLKKGVGYVDGAKWYKSLILLKKGKSDAAKTLLQELTNTNGSYKERAVKKLAELGF